MKKPAHVPAFKDWLQNENAKTHGTAAIYARFLTRCAEHYDVSIDENTIRADTDVHRIISAVASVVSQRGRWAKGTFNQHDIADNLTPALRAYMRFVQHTYPAKTGTVVALAQNAPHSAPNGVPDIQHQDLFEEYFKEGGRISIVQYLSSLRRAANLLNEDITPALLPNENAVENVLNRLRQGRYKNDKFGPVATALRRYAEMGEKNFIPGLQVADDVPTDELPARLKVEVTRIVRDVGLAKVVKELHGHACQICGIRLELSPGRFYSEGHHLKPLGKKHNGPDVKDNILCVCPNCHVRLDFNAMKIDPAALQTVSGHAIRKEFIDYHNQLCS